jgi:hypothetical protein
MPPRKKATPQVPGEAPGESAAPTPRARRAAAAAAPSPAPMPPAIERAVANAKHMTYAEAQAADAEGKLTRRVLTEKGWYVPKPAQVVE